MFVGVRDSQGKILVFMLPSEPKPMVMQSFLEGSRAFADDFPQDLRFALVEIDIQASDLGR